MMNMKNDAMGDDGHMSDQLSQLEKENEQLERALVASANNARIAILELEKKLLEREVERKTYHDMVVAIAQDQNPVKVLCEGMTMVIERDAKIQELQDRLQVAERRGDENYEHLQNVMEIRDQLLTHIYTVLDRPDGIMIHEMPEAIARHKRHMNQLEEESQARYGGPR